MQYHPSCYVIHKGCEACSTIEEMFEEAEAQKQHECQNENLRLELGGRILKSKNCNHMEKK